jgi:hypothetical protein
VPTPTRQIAAFRQRLVGDPSLDPLSAQLVAIVGDRVYPTFLVDVIQPVYPCITLFQSQAEQAVWAPRTFDYGVMQLQIWSKKDLQECWDAYELVTQLLHEKKTLTSTSQLCVHQVREIWSDSGIWVAEDSVWRQSVRYQFRASVIGG